MLDKNPLKVDPLTIRDIKVVATIKEGKTVYKAGAKPPPAVVPVQDPDTLDATAPLASAEGKDRLSADQKETLTALLNKA